MLKYRFYVSRVNKLVLIFGAYCLVLLHTYRLSSPGKLCSGDYLSEEQKADPTVANNYLIQRGDYFKLYINIFWIHVVVTVVTLIGLGKLVVDAVF